MGTPQGNGAAQAFGRADLAEAVRSPRMLMPSLMKHSTLKI